CWRPFQSVRPLLLQAQQRKQEQKSRHRVVSQPPRDPFLRLAVRRRLLSQWQLGCVRVWAPRISPRASQRLRTSQCPAVFLLPAWTRDWTAFQRTALLADRSKNSPAPVSFLLVQQNHRLIAAAAAAPQTQPPSPRSHPARVPHNAEPSAKTDSPKKPS